MKHQSHQGKQGWFRCHQGRGEERVQEKQEERQGAHSHGRSLQGSQRHGKCP